MAGSDAASSTTTGYKLDLSEAQRTAYEESGNRHLCCCMSHVTRQLLFSTGKVKVRVRKSLPQQFVINKMEEDDQKRPNRIQKLRARLTATQIILVFLIVLTTAFICLCVEMISTQSVISKLTDELKEIHGELCVDGYCSKRTSRREVEMSSPAPLTQSMATASHLQGIGSVRLEAVYPQQTVRDDGHIGPWTITNRTLSEFVRITRNGTEVEIVHSGEYLVFTQVYYITFDSSNSYEVVRLRAGTKSKESLATCSAQGPGPGASEVSCFTGAMATLDAGDRIYLNQVEQVRHISFNNGGTSFYIVRLS